MIPFIALPASFGIYPGASGLPSGLILLLHMDTAWKDDGPSNVSFAATGSPSIITDASAFGGKQMTWPRSANQYILGSKGSNFLASSTSSVTVEFFMTGLSWGTSGGFAGDSYSILVLLSSGSLVLTLASTGSGRLGVSQNNGTFSTNFSSNILASRVHVAFVRNIASNNTSIYVGGSRFINIASTTAWNFDSVKIGTGNSGTSTMSANVDEVAVWDYAKYSGTSITVPTGPY